MNEEFNPIDEMILECDETDKLLKDLKCSIQARAKFWQIKATLLLAKENKRIANALELIHKYNP